MQTRGMPVAGVKAHPIYIADVLVEQMEIDSEAKSCPWLMVLLVSKS